jgi:hypothetical protein
MLGERAVTKAERIAEFKKRKQRVQQYKCHPADLQQWLSDGWESTGRSLKDGRAVLQKLKPHDEILENRFWSVLYQLGYDELNIGRKFKIQITDGGHGKEVFKQVDVFAKDADTVVVAECKSSIVKGGSRTLQKDIMEFATLQKLITRAVNAEYGKDEKLKFVWIFVTRNIAIAPNDRKRADQENIQIISDRDLRYYEEIAKNIGRAAKYQFLAEFLAGSKVKNLEHPSIPAIRAKVGGNQAYYFLSSPERLLPIAFVNHRSLRDPSGYPTYQRLIKRARLRQIGSFLIALSGRGDFVFVDPPYTIKHNHNGFIKYNQKLFGWEDQLRLRHSVEKASLRGVHILLTNANHHSVRQLYRGLGTMFQLTRASIISATSEHRRASSELAIAIGYPVKPLQKALNGDDEEEERVHC